MKKLTGDKKTALRIEYLTAKSLRRTSHWGHNKGAEFDAFCESKNKPNDVKQMGPSKGTRHHMRFASMVWLFLAAPLICAFIKRICKKTERESSGKDENESSDSPKQANHTNRCVYMSKFECRLTALQDNCRRAGGSYRFSSNCTVRQSRFHCETPRELTEFAALVSVDLAARTGGNGR